MAEMTISPVATGTDVKSTEVKGTVRDVAGLWKKVILKDPFGQYIVKPLATSTGTDTPTEYIEGEGFVVSKKEKIKAKLEEAKRNREMAVQARDSYIKQRNWTQSCERFEVKSFNWLKKLFGLNTGLGAGIALGSELPTTLWGKIGFHICKFLGGILGVKGEEALTKKVDNETDKVIDPLTSDQKIDAKGISKQEIADCEATIKYWDAKVAKYEKMLEGIEDKELLG